MTASIRTFRAVEKQYLDELMKVEYTEDLKKSLELDLTTSEDYILKYENSLQVNHIWTIFRNLTYKRVPFLVGDEPVLLVNSINQGIGFKNNALENPHTVVCFPITPQYIICLYHKDSILAPALTDYEDRCTAIYNDIFVERQNALQLANCTRQLFIYPKTELGDAISK